MSESPATLLSGPAGAAALAAAAELANREPLAAAAALRRAGIAPDVAAAALTQAELRRRAVGKFGGDAARLLFTRAGLEQATRGVVARRRAARLSEAGVRAVADLGCGIGADSLAFAQAGLRVLAIESDPATAEIARANSAALGLAGAVEVRCADATTVDLSRVDAAFCDPARRAGDRRRFDPHAYSPPWSFVVELAARVPQTVLKVAPGIDHDLIPDGAEAEWVSEDGDVVEAALWCGPLAGPSRRRATIIHNAAEYGLVGDGHQRAPVGPIGPVMYAPDGAVVRSHLVAEFAATVGGHLADPRIAYVFADSAAHTPLAACFDRLEPVPFATKRLRAALRERGIGRLEILKRGVGVEPDALRRELRLSGDREASLILLRIGDTPTALLGRRLP